MSAHPPDTRPGGLSERERELIDRIAALIGQARGANVQVSDPRVTAVQNWILVTVGTGIVGALIWATQSINALNATVASFGVTQSQQGRAIEDHEQRLRQQERKP